VQALPTYFGGFVGACEFQWLRTAPGALADRAEAEAAAEAFVAIEGATAAGLELTGRDVQCFVKVQFVPVNTAAERGPTASCVVHARVEEGVPVVSELAIVGVHEEGKSVRVEALYSGGQEGESDIQWLAAAEGGGVVGGVELAPPSSSRELVLPFAAIGRVVHVRYTPKRDTGEAGKLAVCRGAQVHDASLPGNLRVRIPFQDNDSKRLQKFSGERVSPGRILIRQRGTEFHPGEKRTGGGADTSRAHVHQREW
jgi:hypothetical protein